MKEKDLQVQILDGLQAAGITCWLTHKDGAYRHLPIIEGISDIVGIWSREDLVKEEDLNHPMFWHDPIGQFLAIEVKLPGKTPDPAGKLKLTRTELKQIEFLDQVNHAGGIGFFAESLDYVKERLNLKNLKL